MSLSHVLFPVVQRTTKCKWAREKSTFPWLQTLQWKVRWHTYHKVLDMSVQAVEIYIICYSVWHAMQNLRASRHQANTVTCTRGTCRNSSKWSRNCTEHSLNVWTCFTPDINMNTKSLSMRHWSVSTVNDIDCRLCCIEPVLSVQYSYPTPLFFVRLYACFRFIICCGRM